jgi:glyoxylase-like metal-dependent hydrolase (beta-lactamase superfamily II)
LAQHYSGDDLIVRKIRVGELENNTYLFECPRTHDALLIDGCFEPEVILAKTEGANVVAIVQTHGHHDHVQALPELKRRLGVEVCAHPGDAYPTPVERVLDDGDTIAFGASDVRVLHTPGHTPGSISLLSGRHLVSGDTLFPGGPGNTGGDPARFATIMESLDTKLFVLDDDTVVYPGHGDDTTIGAERPYVEEWRARGW